MIPKLKKLAVRWFSAAIVIQARFVAWQVGLIAQDVPATSFRVSELLEFVNDKQIPVEMRMVVSKLVVARRRGI